MESILEFLPEAKVDAEEATKYYESQVRGLGLRFRIELEKICEAIIRQPLLWRERLGGYRRVNFPSFPYYIAYFIRNERIIVAAVGHAARHPNYWTEREI